MKKKHTKYFLNYESISYLSPRLLFLLIFLPIFFPSHFPSSYLKTKHSLKSLLKQKKNPYVSSFKQVQQRKSTSKTSIENSVNRLSFHFNFLMCHSLPNSSILEFFIFSSDDENWYNTLWDNKFIAKYFFITHHICLKSKFKLNEAKCLRGRCMRKYLVWNLVVRNNWKSSCSNSSGENSAGLLLGTFPVEGLCIQGSLVLKHASSWNSRTRRVQSLSNLMMV